MFFLLSTVINKEEFYISYGFDRKSVSYYNLCLISHIDIYWLVYIHEVISANSVCP